MTGVGVHTIKISGDVGLRQARALAETLKADLAEHSAIAVVCDDLTSIDITILQLLIAARKTALAAAKTLTVHAQADGPLPALLRRAGFVDGSGTSITPEGDFWHVQQPGGKAA